MYNSNRRRKCRRKIEKNKRIISVTVVVVQRHSQKYKASGDNVQAEFAQEVIFINHKITHVRH